MVYKVSILRMISNSNILFSKPFWIVSRTPSIIRIMVNRILQYVFLYVKKIQVFGYVFVFLHFLSLICRNIALLAGAVQYYDCISAEG